MINYHTITLLILCMYWNSTFAMKRPDAAKKPIPSSPLLQKHLEQVGQKGHNAVQNTDHKKFNSFLRQFDALAQKAIAKNK